MIALPAAIDLLENQHYIIMKRNSLNPKIRQALSIAVAMVLLASLQGCKYYYKVQTVKTVTPQEVKQYSSLNRYIIIHQRDKAWHFTCPLISDSTLYGKLLVLPENRYKFLTTKPTGGNRYIKNRNPNETYVLEEVHLFVADSVIPEQCDSGNIKIAFSKIQNAEVYIKAKGRTTASWLVPAIGVPVLVCGVVGIIAGTSKNLLGIHSLNLTH